MFDCQQPPRRATAPRRSRIVSSDSGSTRPLLVERRAAPEWLGAGLPGIERDALEDACGEQVEWGFAIPWLFQALAAPSTWRPLLSSVRERLPQGQIPHAPTTAYWSSLLTLLIYSFGWPRPDRGLKWWYDAGKPVDDVRLQLLSQVWGADGQLDWFAAWLWTTPVLTLAPEFSALSSYRGDRAPVDVDQRWMDDTRAGAARSGLWNPSSDSEADPLHLSAHCSAPLQAPRLSESVMLTTSPQQRRAVLLVERMAGWYRALVEHGGRLPDLGHRSWHVDVIVRPVGTLGTFRRSRATGLWFAGPHQLHVRGT